MPQRAVLKEKILNFIDASPAFSLSPGTEHEHEQEFHHLALEVFAYQFENNVAYQRLCRLRNATPETVERWQDIPAVTTTSFKSVPLFCHPLESAGFVFYTSGTTRSRPGVHYFHDLELYKKGSLKSFAAACLDDNQRLPMLIIGPSAEFFPHSSLGRMFSWCMRQYGEDGSAILFTPRGVDVEFACDWLEEYAGAGKALIILATSLALADLVTALEEDGARIPLPAGSRILDTGGSKGRHLAIPRAELLQRTASVFALPETMIFNEYGMTEMSSQYYQTSILSRQLGADPAVHLSSPWLRSLACDPDTLELLPEGSTGILRHFDLLNLDSVAMLQTEDLGQVQGHSLILHGRLPGAEPRGCSLLTESLLAYRQ